MENRGGRREGAGRPLATKTLLTQRINDEITKRVHEQIGPMIDAQIKSVLAEKSNTTAFRILLEYAVGKPKETIEIESDENKLINIDIGAILEKAYGRGVSRRDNQVSSL